MESFGFHILWKLENPWGTDLEGGEFILSSFQ